MKIFNFFKKKCRHDPDMYIKIEDSEMAEPGCELRNVKIRLCVIKCLKCKQILKLSPLGVVHDPKNGIIMDCEEKEEHAVLSNKEKKQLLKEIGVSYGF